MLDQQSDESDKSIQDLEAYSTDHGGVVVLLSKGPVAQVHAHLGGLDQVIGLQQAMEVDLIGNDGEGLSGVLAN